MTKDGLTVLNQKILLDAGFLSVSRTEFTYRTPGGGENSQVRLVVHQASSVAAIVHNPDENCLYFVKQFRYPAYRPGSPALADNGWLTELVAGRTGLNETTREAMVREVEEETGLKVIEIDAVGTFFLSPGASNEQLSLFYTRVEGAPPVRDHLGVGDEWIESVRLTPEAFLAKVEAMTLNDAKTIVAAEYIRRRPDLFKLGGAA